MARRRAAEPLVRRIAQMDAVSSACTDVRLRASLRVIELPRNGHIAAGPNPLCCSLILQVSNKQKGYEMNRVTRTLAILLSATFASVITASLLLFFGARSGHTLFGFTLANYIPVGAIGAGLVAAAGLLVGALMLHVRPAPVVAIGLLFVSAATVYVIQSADATLSTAGRIAAQEPVSFLQFLVNATINSPLEFRDPHGPASSSASAPLNPAAAQAIPQTGAENDAQVQSISSGVQGVVSSQDMGSNVAAGGAQRLSQLGGNIQSLSSNVQNHGTQWVVMALQVFGFSIGSLLVYSFLRSRPHCEDCHLLLSRKGAQTRYFERLDEINGSVEDVLAKAKNRRLQLAVQAHGARGAAKKGKATAFASTIRVSLCTRCQAHRMDFRAMRKSGGNWKEIPVLGYTASSFEPVEVSG